MITFYVLNSDTKNFIFLTFTPGLKENTFEPDTSISKNVGFETFLEMYQNKTLKDDTIIEVRNKKTNELLAKGYVYQLMDYFRSGESFLIKFTDTQYGLMVPLSILSDTLSILNLTIDNIGTVILSKYQKQTVKCYVN